MVIILLFVASWAYRVSISYPVSMDFLKSLSLHLLVCVPGQDISPGFVTMQVTLSPPKAEKQMNTLRPHPAKFWKSSFSDTPHPTSPPVSQLTMKARGLASAISPMNHHRQHVCFISRTYFPGGFHSF